MLEHILPGAAAMMQAAQRATLRFCFASVANLELKVRSLNRSATRLSLPQCISSVRTRPNCGRGSPNSDSRCRRSEVCARPSRSYRRANNATSLSLQTEQTAVDSACGERAQLRAGSSVRLNTPGLRSHTKQSARPQAPSAARMMCSGQLVLANCWSYHSFVTAHLSTSDSWRPLTRSNTAS